MSVTIDVLEPVENGRILYQLIAPPRRGAPMQCRISILVQIKNTAVLVA